METLINNTCNPLNTVQTVTFLSVGEEDKTAVFSKMHRFITTTPNCNVNERPLDTGGWNQKEHVSWVSCTSFDQNCPAAVKNHPHFIIPSLVISLLRCMHHFTQTGNVYTILRKCMTTSDWYCGSLQFQSWGWRQCCHVCFTLSHKLFLFDFYYNNDECGGQRIKSTIILL